MVDTGQDVLGEEVALRSVRVTRKHEGLDTNGAIGLKFREAKLAPRESPLSFMPAR